jgi:hypothetical protein
MESPRRMVSRMGCWHPIHDVIGDINANPIPTSVSYTEG